MVYGLSIVVDGVQLIIIISIAFWNRHGLFMGRLVVVPTGSVRSGTTIAIANCCQWDTEIHYWNVYWHAISLQFIGFN